MSSDPEAVSQVLERLLHLLRLEPDWDGYGAPQISRIAVGKAIELLFAARVDDSPTPWIVPMSDGGVSVEWKVEEHELELTVGPDGEVRLFTVNEERNEFFEPDPSPDSLRGWLVALTEIAHETTR